MLKKLARVGGIVGAIILSSSAVQARFFDPQMIIERATNSPVVTIRFHESRARVIELRVNGRSVATRAVVSSNSEQVLKFHVDLSRLEEGTNPMEIRMYAEDGTLVATKQDSLTLDTGVDLPVKIVSPKPGQTLEGIVEIKMDMTRNITKPFVSFMIDGEWKAIRNVEPFTYIWDTESVMNGWHELQVWAVDQNNVTFRSRVVRVLVNNPGGRTDRISTPISNPVPNNTVAAVPIPPIEPLTRMATVATGRLARPAQAVAATAVKNPPIIVSGVRSLKPTGTRLITPVTKPIVKAPVGKAPVLPPVANVKPMVKPVAKPPVAPAVKPVQTAASTMVTLKAGTRLAYAGALSINYNGTPVQFDVAPHVTEGIPMSPLRHLYEQAGGKVKWNAASKSVLASGASQDLFIRIGSDSAKIGGNAVKLEYRAYLRGDRTIVPLSFLQQSLGVQIEVDTATGHVLIRKQ